ncbi:MAG: leucine-rich repeat protein [Clostridia bacterium]|nr:leucine-rich repeat protein [Clostridia bacterium]
MQKKYILPFFIALLISLLCLVACNTSGEGNSAELERANQRVQYLTDQITLLQDELTAQKSIAYMNEVTYKTEIEELKSQIKHLGAIIEDSLTAPPSTETTPPDSNVGATPPTEDAPANDGVTLTYALKNNCAIITGYIGNAQTLNIPATLDGYTVTGIADNAFSRSPFVSVTVPNTVTELGWFAFSEGFALKEITVPESVTKAGYGVFENCSGKLCIICPDGSYISAYAKSYGIQTKTQ